MAETTAGAGVCGCGYRGREYCACRAKSSGASRTTIFNTVLCNGLLCGIILSLVGLILGTNPFSFGTRSSSLRHHLNAVRNALCL